MSSLDLRLSYSFSEFERSGNFTKDVQDIGDGVDPYHTSPWPVIPEELSMDESLINNNNICRTWIGL